jgi:hypothetical protein
MDWMRALHVLLLLAGAVIALAPVMADAGDPRLVVVGRDLGDVGPVLSAFRLESVLVAEVAAVPDDAAVVLVLADAYPAPRELAEPDCRRLEAVARAGGRVFAEFAHWSGNLAGCAISPEPRRPLYERLVVLKPLGELQPEDLLEEHDQACLPFLGLPQDGETLLEYDRAFGTYHRIPAPDPGLFTVTLDLGSEQVLTSAVQRYGAGQPNYYPESVELSLSADGRQFRSVGRVEVQPMPEAVRFELPQEPARFIRFAARKFRRSPVTDFLFMGEVEVCDAGGRNLALNAAYVLQSLRDQSPPYRDDGRKLTDGVVEGLYTDGLSVGWGTPLPPEDARFPALARVPWGEGEALFSTLCISTYRSRSFRLTDRWEALWLGIVLGLLPPERREEIARRRVPLEAHTEPRLWSEPGTAVRLVVQAPPEAEVSAHSELCGPLSLERDGARRVATFAAAAGSDEIRVTARTAVGAATRTESLDGRPRGEKYRQALDRNLAWFRRSGVLPQADGSGGIHSQVCLAWLDSQPSDYDFLGSPFRVDCNAMGAEAFFLYGLVSGDDSCKAIARNLADTVVAHQYTDPGRASLGGFPWLYENNETLFLWDDNCRVGIALLWLYHWTAEERYLRSALLGAELFRQVARDDGCVHRHAIQRGELDSLGREAYRQFAQGADPEFRLMHWWSLAAATGDATYRELAETCSRLWGPAAGVFGGSFSARYAADADLTSRLSEQAEAVLRSPQMQRFGMATVGGGDYAAAFEGDCGIATADGEPLTDQLYDTPWRFLWALRAWKATGSQSCRRLCETVGDYLARIQFASADPRLDGCWLRGFDAERWEVYGAPYDPAYGPYSAYTGWMNAIAAQAFAWYLLGEAPFIPEGAHPGAAAVLAQVRGLNPALVSDGPDVALGCPYRLSDRSSGAYADDGRKLTDGVIEGPYGDHLSVGWGIPIKGATRNITLDLDLGQPRQLRLVTQQYGAGRGTYNPDLVRVSCSLDGAAYRTLGERRFESTAGAALLWLLLDQPPTVRHLRFEISKRRTSAVTDFLFVGETRAYEPR